jgi:hypothetical protein
VRTVIVTNVPKNSSLGVYRHNDADIDLPHTLFEEKGCKGGTYVLELEAGPDEVLDFRCRRGVKPYMVAWSAIGNYDSVEVEEVLDE